MQAEGTLSKDAALSLRNSYKATIAEALSASASYSPPLAKLDGQWSSAKIDGEDAKMVWPSSPKARTFDTGVGAESLKVVGRASVSVPEKFVSKPKYLPNDGISNRGTTGYTPSFAWVCQQSLNSYREGSRNRLDHCRGKPVNLGRIASTLTS